MKPIDQMTAVELRAFLAARNLPTTGNKSDLLLRATQALTTVVAEQPSSTSTPLKTDRDVNAPYDVASFSIDDAAHEQSRNDQGEQHDPPPTASGTQDSTTLPDNPTSADHDVEKPAPVVSLQSYDIEKKRQALDDWLKLEELQDEVQDEEWTLRREFETRQKKMEDDERRQRQALTRKRRQLKHQYEMYVLHCREAGLPAPPPLDDSATASVHETPTPPGKTVEFTSALAPAVKVDGAGRLDCDVDSTDVKTPAVTNASVSVATTQPVATMTTVPRDVRPKMSIPTSTAISQETSAPAPPQPPVSNAPATHDNYIMHDRSGRNVGYLSQATGLVMTDPNAAAPLTSERTVATLPPLDPNVSAFQPSFTTTRGDESLKQIVDLINLPKPNLINFAGDPLAYHMFMNAFDSCVGKSSVDDASKLNRLLELCQGKARAVIKSCSMKEPSAGYARARQLLKERFGDPYVISEAWVTKIVDGPVVKPNNIESLQNFTDDVRDCVETLMTMKMLNEVDTRTRLVRLMNRLPTYLITRWSPKVTLQLRMTTRVLVLMENQFQHTRAAL